MNTLLLEIFIVFLLLLANGVFALAEISVVSSRKGRLKMLADEGSPAAAQALALAMQPGPIPVHGSNRHHPRRHPRRRVRRDAPTGAR